jgi:hypothetical protein
MVRLSAPLLVELHGLKLRRHGTQGLLDIGRQVPSCVCARLVCVDAVWWHVHALIGEITTSHKFSSLRRKNAFFSTTTGPNSTNPELFQKRAAMRRRWRWDRADRRGSGRMRSGSHCGSGGDATW